MTVVEMGYHPFLARTHLKLLKTQYLALQLDERHVLRQLVAMVDTTPIDIFIRIVFQQLAEGLDVEFTAQHLLFLRSHAGNIHHILRQ